MYCIFLYLISLIAGSYCSIANFCHLFLLVHVELEAQWNINKTWAWYWAKGTNAQFLYAPVIALSASVRARWPQRTTGSPGQRRWRPTADTWHCAPCWKAEGPKVRGPNTQPGTGTPPPPDDTHTHKHSKPGLLTPKTSSSSGASKVTS